MTREPELSVNAPLDSNPTDHLSMHDLVLMYLIWFAFTGICTLTRSIVLWGSEFLTEGLHYLFFITLRLFFIPAALYFVIYRGFLSTERVGLTFHHCFQLSKQGLKIGWLFIPLTLVLVHLPLAYSGNLKPLIIATTPEKLSVSLVYSFLLFFMTLIPAFSEELLFRGLTFSFLAERAQTWQAMLLSSLIYTLFYLQFNIYLVIFRFTLGFFSTYLFWRSKSLLPSTMVQAMLHTAMCVYVFGLDWW